MQMVETNIHISINEMQDILRKQFHYFSTVYFKSNRS
jgi:hypothetical protein